MRTYDILDYLREHKRCSLTELMEKFNVSSATIHRDVVELIKGGAVERFRGGLIFAEGPLDYQSRVIANVKAKEEIAEQALKFVAEGDILFLDSSTTVFMFAQRLRQTDFAHLTILTNSVSIIENFRTFPAGWVLIALGGNYDGELNSILGASALAQLDGFNITKAFVSAFGLNAKMATTNHERQAEIVRKVLAAAEKRYLLIDQSKMGRTGLYRLSARGGFDAIVSC